MTKCMDRVETVRIISIDITEKTIDNHHKIKEREKAKRKVDKLWDKLSLHIELMTRKI